MKIFTIFLIAIALIGCGKKKDNKFADHLGINPVEPPVESSLPDGLKTSDSASLSLTTECGPLATDVCTDEQKLYTLKSRIFEGKAGCMESAADSVQGRILCALDAIDNRIASLDNQASNTENKKMKCLDEPLQDFSMVIPDVGTFEQKYNCYSQLSTPDDFVGEAYIAFGIEGDTLYLKDVQTQGMMTLVKVTQSTKEVETVRVETKTISSTVVADSTPNKTQGAAADDGKHAIGIMHILANPTGKIFQFSHATNHSMGSGVGCGVQIRANESNVFAQGIFAELASTSMESNCATPADESSNDRYLQTCIKAKDLEADATANCSPISTFDLEKIYPADIYQEFFDTFTDIGFASSLTNTSEFVDL